jgi:hypothetical protein
MKAKWSVLLLKRARGHTWPVGFFPRHFVYKHEAMDLVREIINLGGEAELIYRQHHRGPQLPKQGLV